MAGSTPHAIKLSDWLIFTGDAWNIYLAVMMVFECAFDHPPGVCLDGVISDQPLNMNK
jgi:hypothetical protein